MSDLVVSNSNLPTKIEDLTKFVLVGRERLTAMRAELRAMNSLHLDKSIMEQRKFETQLLAEDLLDCEARIGEKLREIPKEQGKRTDIKPSNTVDTKLEKPKEQVIKDLGFNKMQVSRFETLAENKPIIEQIKAEARDKDEIVTRTAVLEQVKKVNQEVKRQEIKIEPPKQLDGCYDIIYADPPWKYDFAESESRAIENHYPTMDLEDIKNIKVPSADNSVLFLWATAPKLLEALEVITAWGFTYKTQAIWDKELIGSGYWFRGQHEILIVATKGKYSPPIPENRVSSVYREKRTTHSKKPSYYYDLLEKSFPNQRYLEMFSRSTHNEKWAVWGNQSE